MKVLHLSSCDGGGAGKAALRAVEGLRARGVDATLLVLGRRRRHPDPGAVALLPARGLAERWRRWRRPAGRYDALFRGWRALLQAYPRRPAGLEIFSAAESPYDVAAHPAFREADVVHLHWVAGMLDVRRAGEVLAGKRVFWTLHDMNPFTGGCHYAGGCGRWREACGACPQLASDDAGDLTARSFAQKREAYRGLDIRVVTPSRWLAARAAESSLLSRFPVEVVPNGVPTAVFRPSPRAEARRALGLPEEARVLLFGADYDTRRKGFAHLLEALRLLPARLQETVVLASFGGLPGPPPGRYRSVQLGSIGDERRLALAYAAATAFVIPSEEDNLPNTVLEALSCGTPVVGFAVGGIPEMVDEATGRLAPPADPAGLAWAIEALLAEAAGRDFAPACRERAERCFTVELQAERLARLYAAG